MFADIEDTINFQQRSLKSLESVPWGYDGFVSVEFFRGCSTPIRVTSVSVDNFEELLNWVDDGREYLYMDLEWRPDRKGEQHRPCLFQIGSSKGALVIRHPTDLPASLPLLDFLNSHKFYMKGMGQDRLKLQLLYGNDIDLSRFTDIEKTMLGPLGASLNFQAMVNQWSSKDLSAQFKNKSISRSNWEAPTLKTGQVLYAAFDVVSLHEVVNGLLAYIKEHPSEMQTNGKQPNRGPANRRCRKKGKMTAQSGSGSQAAVKVRRAQKKTNAATQSVAAVQPVAPLQTPGKVRRAQKKTNAPLQTPGKCITARKQNQQPSPMEHVLVEEEILWL